MPRSRSWVCRLSSSIRSSAEDYCDRRAPGQRIRRSAPRVPMRFRYTDMSTTSAAAGSWAIPPGHQGRALPRALSPSREPLNVRTAAGSRAWRAGWGHGPGGHHQRLQRGSRGDADFLALSESACSVVRASCCSAATGRHRRSCSCLRAHHGGRGGSSPGSRRGWLEAPSRYCRPVPPPHTRWVCPGVPPARVSWCQPRVALEWSEGGRAT
jgi:hypothetical protein